MKSQGAAGRNRMAKNKQDKTDDVFFAECLKLASGPNGLIGHVWAAEDIKELNMRASALDKDPLDLIAEHRNDQ